MIAVINIIVNDFYKTLAFNDRRIANSSERGVRGYVQWSVDITKIINTKIKHKNKLNRYNQIAVSQANARINKMSVSEL